MQLEDSWPHKERFILKFQGIDSIGDAEPLIGGEIQIPKQERAHLEEGSAYVADMIGCTVWASSSRASAREIGRGTNVIFGAGEAPILEIREGTREHLVPLANEYIRNLDIASKNIELELPDGMLELDAPLSAEEKKSQKSQ